MAWKPKYIERFVEAHESSTQVVVVDTDAGRGYLKPLNNPESPHCLVCELVGTSLAEWFGLRTLDWEIIEIDPIADVRMRIGQKASGPAWITQAVNAGPWSGKPRANRKSRKRYNRAIYRHRNQIERFFGRIKRCRRIATRYEKKPQNFAGFI